MPDPQGLKVEVSEEEFEGLPQKKQLLILFQVLMAMNGTGCSWGRNFWKRFWKYVLVAAIIGGIIGSIMDAAQQVFRVIGW